MGFDDELTREGPEPGQARRARRGPHGVGGRSRPDRADRHARWGGDGWEPPWAESRWQDPAARRRRRLYARTFFAALIFLIEAAGVHWAAQNETPARPLDQWGYALLAVGCVALIGRLRWRIPMLVVTVGTALAYVLAGYPLGPVFGASIISVIGALRAHRRYGTWITLAVAYAVYVAFGRIFPTIGGQAIVTPSLPTAILVAAWIIVACAIGEGIRNRTERMIELSHMHAEQQRARDEQKRRQEGEERLRIAQELHDVLGHHLSLINVQAGVGLHLMDDDPGQARDSLRAIKQASAEALGEVRAVLSVLRNKDERAPRAPAPGLGDLSALIDDEHTAIEGEPRSLPPDVDRAAFRIVQESLTNVRRHAGAGATATVLVAYEPERLRLVITDNGVGPVIGPVPADGGDAAEPAGGIVGMRTRAEALGGSLRVGPAPERGFRVQAELPLPEMKRPPADRPAAASTGARGESDMMRAPEAGSAAHATGRRTDDPGVARR